MTSLEEYIEKSIEAHNSEGSRMHLLIFSPVGYRMNDRLMSALGGREVVEVSLVTEAGLRGTFDSDGKYIPGLLKKHDKDILLVRHDNLQPWKQIVMRQFLVRGEVHASLAAGNIYFKSKTTIWCLTEPQNIPEELLECFFIVNPRR